MEPIIYVVSVAYGNTRPVCVGMLSVSDASDDEACHDAVILHFKSEYSGQDIACYRVEHVAPAMVSMDVYGQSLHAVMSEADVEARLDGADLRPDKVTGSLWHMETPIGSVITAVEEALESVRERVVECVSAVFAVVEARDMCLGAHVRKFVARGDLMEALASHVVDRRLDVLGRTCLRTYVADDSLSDAQVVALEDEFGGDCDGVVSLMRDSSLSDTQVMILENEFGDDCRGVVLLMRDSASSVSSELACVAYDVIHDRVCEAMLAYPEYVGDAGDDVRRAMVSFLRASERAVAAERLSGLSPDWISADGECRTMTEDERDGVDFARRFLRNDIPDVVEEVREMADGFVWDFSGHRVSLLRSRCHECDVDVVRAGRVVADHDEAMASWERRRRDADDTLFDAVESLFSSGAVRRGVASLSVPVSVRSKLRRVVREGYVTCESVIQGALEILGLPGIGQRTVDVLVREARKALRNCDDSSSDGIDLRDGTCDEVIVWAWRGLLSRWSVSALQGVASLVSSLKARGNEVSACRMSEAEVFATNDAIVAVEAVLSHVKTLASLWDVDVDVVRDLYDGHIDDMREVISDVCPYDVPFVSEDVMVPSDGDDIACVSSDDFVDGSGDESDMTSGEADCVGSCHVDDVGVVDDGADEGVDLSHDGTTLSEDIDDIVIEPSADDDLPPVSDPFAW